MPRRIYMEMESLHRVFAQILNQCHYLNHMLKSTNVLYLQDGPEVRNHS